MARTETLPKNPPLTKWFIDNGASYISHIRLSIRTKLLVAFLIVIVFSGSINALLVVRAMDYKRQYDALIDNITTANSLNGYVKSAIDKEMWDIVKGEITFDQGSQYQILDEVNTKISWMTENTSSQNGKMMLEVIHRTMDTLRYYIDQLGGQMKQGSKYEENVQTLDNIRGVSEVVQEGLQEYMLFEINRTGEKYRETQANFTLWVITSVIVMGGVIIASVLMAWLIAESIYIPIKKLHDVTATITHEDLASLMTGSHADEITELGLSFNIMISRIRQLLDDKIKEQQNLKKSEMRVLQAQINPHFLYNTLDTIIWLAEIDRTDQVVNLVRALSTFFRVTLSKGKDWITIREEIEHVRSYLTIQKVRYQDILDYQILVDDSLLDSTILKLTLQPLVENALYHGIKNKRSGGTIIVRGSFQEPDAVRFEIEDNGIGVQPEQLEQIRAGLANVPDVVEIGEHGYGLNNVNKRIKIYYGENYGLSIDSEYQKGTRVNLLVPYQWQPGQDPLLPKKD